MYVGKDVIFSGNLKPSTDQLKYSYILVLPSNEKLGLISTKTSIGNYTGTVSIKGTVNSYDNKFYVIDVSFITADTNTALSTDGSSAKTYIADANLLIDVSANASAIAVNRNGNAITLTDTVSGDTGDVVTLNYFTCQKSDPLKDCDLINTSAQGGEQFTTTPGLTFRKLPETTKWFAKSDSMGYMVDAPKDAFFYKASAYFVPLTTKYIQSRIQDQAANYCYNANSKLGNIAKQTTTVKGNIWTTTVEGTDTDGKKITCTIDMTSSDHKENFSLTSYIISNDGTTATTTTGTTSTTTGSTSTPTQPTMPSTVGKVPGPTATGYLFVSNRGNYSIYFPSQKISFEGVNLDEAFGLEKTNCYVDIQVKSYADRDNTGVAPGVEIYECVTKLTVDEIKAKLPQYGVVESADTTKMFIIRTNAASWETFSAGIVIQ